MMDQKRSELLRAIGSYEEKNVRQAVNEVYGKTVAKDLRVKKRMGSSLTGEFRVDPDEALYGWSGGEDSPEYYLAIDRHGSVRALLE